MENTLFHLDLTMYAIITLCCLVSLIMFIMFWKKVGKVSYVFKLLMVLLLGIIIQDVGTFILLVQKHLALQDAFMFTVASPMWKGRTFIKMLALVAFTVHFIWRYRHMDGNGNVNYGRRKGDKPFDEQLSKRQLKRIKDED